MRALVVYESMFGNTEEIARAVAEGLAETLDVDIHEVRTAPEPGAHPTDLVVVGGPTHAFSLSRPSTRGEAIEKGATHGSREMGLREWIGRLEGGVHRERVATFDTRAEKVRHLPGSAARKATRLLRHDGFQSAGSESFFVSDVDGPLLPGEQDRATAWGRQLAAELSTPRSPEAKDSKR